MDSLHVHGQRLVDATEPKGWTPCCMESVNHGHEACTCWEPVYEQEQAEPVGFGKRPVRRSMCSDCAYRPGSPERADEWEWDRLYALPYGETPFWCHQGMRRIVAWRHPDGREVAADPGTYEPLIVTGVVYQADGQRAAVCGGWQMRHDRIVQAVAKRAVEPWQQTQPVDRRGK